MSAPTERLAALGASQAEMDAQESLAIALAVRAAAASGTFTFNPSPAEIALLWLIGLHESSNNYTAQNPYSTASGRWQFIDSTWQMMMNMLGLPLSQYPTAGHSPPAIQDLAGLLLLRLVGPNSSESWQASGPYPTFAEVKGMLTAIGVVNP